MGYTKVKGNGTLSPSVMAQRITLAVGPARPQLAGKGTRSKQVRHPSCLPLGIHALTARERQVIEQRRAGLPYKLLAPQLGISIHTAKMHARHAFDKLGVNSSLEACAVLWPTKPPGKRYTLLGT